MISNCLLATPTNNLPTTEAVIQKLGQNSMFLGAALANNKIVYSKRWIGSVTFVLYCCVLYLGVSDNVKEQTEAGKQSIPATIGY
jgi:hypothetical protein